MVITSFLRKKQSEISLRDCQMEREMCLLFKETMRWWWWWRERKRGSNDPPRPLCKYTHWHQIMRLRKLLTGGALRARNLCGDRLGSLFCVCQIFTTLKELLSVQQNYYYYINFHCLCYREKTLRKFGWRTEVTNEWLPISWLNNNCLWKNFE